MIKTLPSNKSSILTHFSSVESEHTSNEMLKPINVAVTTRTCKAVFQEISFRCRYNWIHLGKDMRNTVIRITEDAARERACKYILEQR
jgi:hypothetical protein